MARELTSADDTLHIPPDTADTWWTETFWFTFAVPEERLFGNLYLYFRPLLGSIGGGLWLFDDTGTTPWDAPYVSFQHHLPLPDDLDMRDAQLPGGLYLRALEAGSRYAFGIENDEITAHLQFDAIAAPLLTFPKPKPPFTGAHHVDQPGHVTGRISLAGKEMVADAYLMRDRSWGRRTDLRGVKAGYDYAFPDADNGFLGLSLDQGEDRVVMGFVIRDGEWHRAVGGRRHVERDASGMPTAIDIEVVDEAGRKVSGRGDVVTRFSHLIYPSMLVHQGLVRWETDLGTAWAEDQDVWDPRQWRAFRRR